jgi:ribosomal protein L15
MDKVSGYRQRTHDHSWAQRDGYKRGKQGKAGDGNHGACQRQLLLHL